MTMVRIIAALAASLAIATPSAAAVTFQVFGTFDWAGSPRGGISGSFTTDDALSRVTAVNLTTTDFGGFQAFTYDDIGDIDAQSLPIYFRLTVPMPVGEHQLQLELTPTLTGPLGPEFALRGFEHQAFDGAGNRMLQGAAYRTPPVSVSAPVPEPGAWALMILGFGSAGAVLRGQRRRTPVARG